jgi:hypothetical protein
LLAVGAFFLLRDKAGELPIVGGLVEDTRCPLTNRKPARDALAERPAVAVKVENNPVAYPLSGLERAEVVYEEPVEGGLTRFMAIYHCTDADKIGPVRSARAIDPAIMNPYTLILAAAGGNDIVREALAEEDVVLIDEDGAGDAMVRIERAGIGIEHTLYANSTALRKAGRREFDDAPVDDIFAFGELKGRAARATTINITFSAGASATYEWNGDAWARSDNGTPTLAENGDQLTADNVLIEEHTINFSEVGDVLGAPSPEIEDVTGSGRAVLFRNGRAVAGRWVRDAVEDPVRFETRAGDEMVLAPGRTWIALVPDDRGDVKGSFSYER